MINKAKKQAYLFIAVNLIMIGALMVMFIGLGGCNNG
jgi:hypothetical protein